MVRILLFSTLLLAVSIAILYDRYISPMLFLATAMYETMADCENGIDFYHEHYTFESAGVKCFDELDHHGEKSWTTTL